MGYPGNLDTLWVSLDRDHTGALDFTEFAPENALDLARFKHWSVETFGSVGSMFRALDSDRNGRITFEEFRNACISSGLPARLQESIRTLFLLVDDPNDYASKGVITADEMGFLDTWQCPVYLREKPDMPGRMKFQHALLDRHGGNSIAAWLAALDKDFSMRVNFQEFESACKQLARTGMSEANPKKGVPALYCAFDKHRQGFFSLTDWDAAAHTALFSFTKWVKTRFTKVSDFMRSLEEEKGKGVDMKAFHRGIKGIKDTDFSLTSEETVLLFDGLLLGTSGKKRNLQGGETTKLQVQDILFLDKWLLDDEAKSSEAWGRKALARMGTWLKE